MVVYDVLRVNEEPMACQNCDILKTFREKLGRCKDCMKGLTLLSLVSWPVWFYLDQSSPTSIETLIAFMAAVFFVSFLALHLLVWFITGGKGLRH